MFDELRELESSGASFDVIVLDPPAFAKNRAAVERAAAGYKEINLRAMRLLAPGRAPRHVQLFVQRRRSALPATSCGRGTSMPRRSMTLVEKRMQARDHPVLLTVPETHYLKCSCSDGWNDGRSAEVASRANLQVQASSPRARCQVL